MQAIQIMQFYIVLNSSGKRTNLAFHQPVCVKVFFFGILLICLCFSLRPFLCNKPFRNQISTTRPSNIHELTNISAKHGFCTVNLIQWLFISCFQSFKQQIVAESLKSLILTDLSKILFFSNGDHFSLFLLFVFLFPLCSFMILKNNLRCLKCNQNECAVYRKKHKAFAYTS